jgi:hypothetical protein
MKLPAVLTKDLFENKRTIAASGAVAVAAALTVATALTSTSVLSFGLFAPAAAIVALVALRIVGPKDARSFHLYRKAV